MPKPARGPRLGAGPAHERAILRGLSRDLITHGRIVTTETKAKRLRPFVEKLITKARKGGLHRRRQVVSELQDRRIVHRLFAEVAPRIGDRPGGYTRILKLGQRRGDATPMAIIELVDEPVQARTQPDDEPRRGGRLRRRRRQADEEPMAEEADAAAVASAEASEAEPAESQPTEGSPATESQEPAASEEPPPADEEPSEAAASEAPTDDEPEKPEGS